MPQYHAPLRDHLFCLYDVLDFERHRDLPGFADCSRDVIEAVLEQSATFTRDAVFPLNRLADEQGARLEDGRVITPAGFKQAYDALVAGGWPALTCAPEHGGQGLPHMINILFEEMLNAACLSFGLFPGLTRGAYVALAQHGSAAQIATYAPKLASGEWTGSMCLTEAHCGTDLGLLRTQASPRGDGTYALTGTKIFISAGEHDLAPNIVYLVLARLPGAPKGTKGISLFLVSKHHVNADGTLGARNGVTCGALEQKMGIHGCPTCVMHFDGAVAELVGAPHQGLKAMFAMMNAERIAVGIHGLAIAEGSYQNSVAYARERLQGRAGAAPRDPAKPADPIIVHPDVRRMLLTQKALVEGCRMLALWAAQHLDISEHHADPAMRKAADEAVALLTPVVKAFLTDSGSEVANLGVQVFGGHGFIRANGQEQFVRDARITQLYEGTNGIQSMDLLARKVVGDSGAALARLLAPIEEELAARASNPALAGFVTPVEQGLWRLQEATRVVIEASAADPSSAGAAAVDYLRLMALTLTGFLWSRAAEKASAANSDFHRAKLATARFYMAKILPQTHALLEQIRAGAAPVMDIAEEGF